MNHLIQIIITAINSIFYSGVNSDKNMQDKEIQNTIHEVIYQHIDFVADTNDWILHSIGNGMPLMKLTHVSVGFKVKDPGTVKDARNYLINASADLLRRINEKEELREYLANYPFEIANVEYSLVFVDKNFNMRINEIYNKDEDLITYAYLNNSRISYAIKSKPDGGLKKIFYETYDEALKR